MTLDDRLTLADWRRRVGELYAEVRRIATDDPALAHEVWSTARAALLRDHPQSPVPTDRRAGFESLVWPYDPTLRFEVPVDPAPAPAPDALALELPNSGADRLAFGRIGSVTLPFGDKPRQLSLFWMEGYSGGLFLPFRDATSGTETYGAGRYLLDTAKSADLGGDAARGTLILDFNFAYQPSCAFDPQWACPLAPPDLAVDDQRVAVEQVPDDALARPAVLVQRGDRREPRRLEEGADVGREGRGRGRHAPDGRGGPAATLRLSPRCG